MDFLANLLKAITEGITGIIAPMVEAIKTGFLELIYENPDATGDTKTLSAFAYFLFAMLGISIGVGLVWLVISLFKRRGH